MQPFSLQRKSDSESPCNGYRKCACGMKLDGAPPLHLLSCRQLVATMTLRHNKVLATLMTIAELGVITAKKEVTVDEKGRKRTDGMMVVKGIPTMIGDHMPNGKHICQGRKES